MEKVLRVKARTVKSNKEEVHILLVPSDEEGKTYTEARRTDAAEVVTALREAYPRATLREIWRQLQQAEMTA